MILLAALMAAFVLMLGLVALVLWSPLPLFVAVVPLAVAGMLARLIWQTRGVTR